MNRHQKAAKVSGKIRRDIALNEYYSSPNICKFCGEIIKVGENQKPSETRKKIFCNSSCSTIFNNLRREKKQKIKFVKPEKFSFFDGVTKKEFFNKKGVYYKFRSEIRKHAQYVYEKNEGLRECKVCGYDKHIQVCHIKSVSSFEEKDLITEINSFDNLVGLCPNHHWEYDNGHIKIL
jgi:hypothetical protein